MDTESLVQQYVAHGWDANSARADINNGGWQNKEWITGGSSGSNVDSILSNSISAITGGINKADVYENKNPFSFDEALARQAATAEYSPYYTRTLQDYTQNVQKKTTRSAEDLKSTLNFLAGSKEYFTGTNRKVLEQSLRNTAQGYEGKGLYMSGASKRDLQDIQEENKSKVSEYERGYQEDVRSAKLGDTRTSEDLAYELGQTTRDIGEQQKYAIESGVLTRKNEAREEYSAARQKYYAGLGYIS